MDNLWSINIYVDEVANSSETYPFVFNFRNDPEEIVSVIPVSALRQRRQERCSDFPQASNLGIRSIPKCILLSRPGGVCIRRSPGSPCLLTLLAGVILQVLSGWRCLFRKPFLTPGAVFGPLFWCPRHSLSLGAYLCLLPLNRALREGSD